MSAKKIVEELYQLGLVIESSVRRSEGIESDNYKKVLKLVKSANEHSQS